MKNVSTILSSIALLISIILGVVFFWHQQPATKTAAASESHPVSGFKIAYFEMDSLKVHYNYFKDAEEQAKGKESSMNAELGNMQNKYQKKISEWQQKGAAMTQAEGQQAQQEYAEMQQNFQSRKEALQEELAKTNSQLMADIVKRIETFVKGYNKTKNYSYIISYEPGSFIFYKDSAYNITNDIIEGLNAEYKKKN